MILGSTLQTTFSTAKPLTGESMSSDVAPVLTVYVNGAAIAPGAPPVAAAINPGQYSLVYALTIANGHALGDWVTITAQVSMDGAVVTCIVWEGNLLQAGADVTMLFGSTIYPMCTTHRPSDGTNANQDAGLPPGGGFRATVYQNLVATGIIVMPANPAAGVFILPVALTAVNGFAAGDEVDIEVIQVIDAITKTGWVFSGGAIVLTAGGGGGGVPHHEVLGQALRATG